MSRPPWSLDRHWSQFQTLRLHHDPIVSLSAAVAPGDAEQTWCGIDEFIQQETLASMESPDDAHNMHWLLDASQQVEP